MSSQKINNPFTAVPGYKCFACAPRDINPGGMGMTFSLEGAAVVSDWDPGDSFQGYQGVVHGGIQATAMDEIASWFVYTCCRTAGVTKSIEVNYLKSAAVKNAPFRLKAELRNKDKKSAEIDVRLFDSNGSLCSEGLAVYSLFSPELAHKKFGYPGPDAFVKKGNEKDSSDAASDRIDPMLQNFQNRRSVRRFSNKKISLQDVKDCIAIAGTAPSGANCQPWTFALVTSKSLKKKIRIEAEHVESRFYEKDSTKVWREDLSDLRTNSNKSFLEEAPCLIVLFLQKYGRTADGRKINHYYPTESLGLAAGFLISALHMKGLSTLPYTPAPMNFIMDILDRPENERPYLILPVGHPSDDWTAPLLERKKLDSILVEYGDGH